MKMKEESPLTRRSAPTSPTRGEVSLQSTLQNTSFPLAVAVSGGADSMALLLLTHAYAKAYEGRIVALTVDHGLRPEAAKEALQVLKWAQGRGIEHVILKWEGEKPTTHLQEKAREARYDLLINWCKNNGIGTLLLGHHQEDQEETFWLRLSSGSGLEGLSGMKPHMIREGIIISRPLLQFTKEQLQALLREENQSWIEDPSNHNPKFFRGRFRAFLEEEGLSPPRLLKVMGKLQEDADFIQESLHQALEETVQVHEEGYLTINRQLFETLYPALQKRMIKHLMMWFSGDKYPPRSSQVISVLENLANKEWIASPPTLKASADRNDAPPSSLRVLRKQGEAIQDKNYTSGGIYWVPRKNEILLLREKSAIEDPLELHALQEKTLWDKRFWIDPLIAKFVPRETILAPLGDPSPIKKEITSSLPPRAWPTLPTLWVEGKVAAIPHLCYNNMFGEKDLRKFISLKPLFHDSLRFTI